MARLVAKHVGHQAVRGGGIGLARKDPRDAARGLVQLVREEMDPAEHHQRIAVLRLRGQIPAERGLGAGEVAQLVGADAEVEPGSRELRLER
ncbi:hypothetical protein D3C83_98260 [compost metagenome]